ncbi:class I adenylate-forming enzyme family protein [Nocardioides sp. CFH 31398]|uniref:class I adenylate-forming enzyme family protein n=1 Tax=Nocardioides sp. CFH 31398 TaxID=2919579 RepID=UPI001F05FA2D|nr:AMP-binding protein [Nocardioides sp. CFH 31398]MCH1867889.1 AMP-binding protein [Nocardioides sp. CFH 31398]
MSDTDLVAAWDARVAAAPDRPALAYFDTVLTAAEVDRLSDEVAAAYATLGVEAGSHVGVHLQNVPWFPLSMLALWKLGAAAVLLNPMYRGEELRALVEDAGAVGVVTDLAEVGRTREALAGPDAPWVVGASSRDLQTRDDPRVLGDDPAPERDPSGADDLAALVRAQAGAPVDHAVPGGDAVAMLCFTSGTTGRAKGAMNTHAGVLAVCRSYAAWTGLGPGGVCFATAPLFHITGAVINATIALVHDATLVLAHRFAPAVALDAFAEHGVTTTIGSITAFSAMLEVPDPPAGAFASMTALYSGGAPIPPSVVERFEDRFGVYVHNAYGMTETCSGVIAVPLGERAPVDPASGTLSVGKPLPGMTLRVLGADGEPVAPGEQGELEMSGPQVVPGYWRRPDATEETMPGGRLRSGDVAVVDDEGWVYLVDRLKDQINVSGYKVWPREVEDALHTHPAVREAAVVGRPDDYQGESVVAYVALVGGGEATPEELRETVRGRLAAYKVPKEVHVVEDLPKTQTGKIRRAALRD